MQKTFPMILGALLLAALVITAFWRLEQRPPPAPTPTPPAPAADAAAEATAADALRLRRAGDIAQVREAVRAGNVPISFLGRVVDGEGRPLPGVAVHYRVRGGYEAFGVAWSGFTGYTARTDAHGRFEISGRRGDQLEIESCEKDGYHLAPGQEQVFHYNGPLRDGFQPDALEPVPFVLRRDNAAVPAASTAAPSPQNAASR